MSKYVRFNDRGEREHLTHDGWIVVDASPELSGRMATAGEDAPMGVSSPELPEASQPPAFSGGEADPARLSSGPASDRRRGSAPFDDFGPIDHRARSGGAQLFEQPARCLAEVDPLSVSHVQTPVPFVADQQTTEGTACSSTISGQIIHPEPTL